MITVTGIRYRYDNNCPKFKKQFDNLGQLSYYIQNECLGKKSIRFPAQNDDGSFDQRYAGTFSGALRYDDEESARGNPSVIIKLIKDDGTGQILFSSGDYTDKTGHISTIMKDMLTGLKHWTTKEYDFAG